MPPKLYKSWLISIINEIHHIVHHLTELTQIKVKHTLKVSNGNFIFGGYYQKGNMVIFNPLHDTFSTAGVCSNCEKLHISVVDEDIPYTYLHNDK